MKGEKNGRRAKKNLEMGREESRINDRREREE